MKLTIRTTGLLGLAMVVFMNPVPLFAETVPNCVSSHSDPDGDGWGWENAQSCRVVRGPCVDTDGDGWGWDGAESCRVETQSCVDTDGDGWGWDGQNSCLVTEDPALTVAGDCEDTPPLHDTWGWNGVASCRLPPPAPQTDTSAIAGLWDVSNDDETLYLDQRANGTYVTYLYIDEGCYELQDPNADPDVSGAHMVALGNNQYEIYFYEIYDEEMYEERDIYVIFITGSNELSLTSDGYYDEYLEEYIEPQTSYFSAIAMSAEDIELCVPVD